MQTLFLLVLCGSPPPPVSTLERDLERIQVAPRRVPCEVRPAPPAEIEESSDRDPVQPVPKPAPPRKGRPDGRMVADADVPPLEGPQLAQNGPLRVSGTRDEVFAHFVGLARAEGRPHGFRWSGSDGEVARLRANPDGTVEVAETNRRPVVASGPASPPVIPAPQVSAPVYYPPAVDVRAMPAREVPGPTFRGRFPEDHSCPACGHRSVPGTGNWVVRGFTATGHLHRCERCGYEGEH